MVKILNYYLNAKKSYCTLSKGAIFFWPSLCKTMPFLDQQLLKKLLKQYKERTELSTENGQFEI